MKTNAYFESMTKTAEAYEAARQSLKEKKPEGSFFLLMSGCQLILNRRP